MIAEKGRGGWLSDAAAANDVPLWALCLLLFCLVFALYYRTTGYGFIGLDDPVYVSENPQVLRGLSWDGLNWAFSLDGPIYYHPLTWLSLMLDASLYGQSAGGYHATNMLMHGANAILLFLLVFRLVSNRWVALAVGALFALHPMHVEAVAWVTSRKDVLSTLIGLASMHAYVSWTRGGGQKWYLLSIGLHGLGLMAKPMLVTMPGLLLLLDLWPLRRACGHGAWPSPRRLGVLVIEKLPFLALGVLFTLLTIKSHPDAYSVYQPDLMLKLSNSIVSYIKYLRMMVLPWGLAVMYPFPDAIPVWQPILGLAALIGVTTACIWQWPRRPYLAVGWLWYLLAMLPVIIPPKVGMTMPMADRWAYVPFWGLYLAVAMLAAEILPTMAVSKRGRPGVLVGCLITFLLLAAVAWRQVGFWKDPYTIYERSLAVTGGSYYTKNSYGVLMLRKGEYAKAEKYLSEAVAMFPDASLALANLGHVYAAQGRFAEALEMFRRALPGDSAPGGLAHEDHNGMGLCLAQLGRLDEAEEQYRKALELKPDYAMPYNDLGNIALTRGDVHKARELYEKALELDPKLLIARENLSRVKVRLSAGG